MEITKVTIHPNNKTLEPEFLISVNYSYKGSPKLLVKCKCFLFLSGTRIAILHDYSARGGNCDYLTSIGSGKGETWKDSVAFLAPITRAALNKIEESRDAHKGDVFLNVQMEFTCIESSFGILRNPAIKNKAGEVCAIPSLRDEALFKFQTYFDNEGVTIESSRWIKEFCPVFESTRYQVFELPIPQITGGSGILHERIDDAIKSLAEMEKARNNSDWHAVIKESRLIWELIHDKAEIETLLQSENYNAQTLESFHKLVSSLWDFGSKFNHKIPKGGGSPMKRNHPAKEDAELIYAIAFSLVNLISRKLYRQG